MEGQADAGCNKRRREDSEGKRLPAGGGVSIMPGTGQSIKNVQDIVTVIKFYVVNSSWTKPPTILKHRGGGFDYSPTPTVFTLLPA